MARALAFYRDLLGLRVTGEMVHDAGQLARLGGPRGAQRERRHPDRSRRIGDRDRLLHGAARARAQPTPPGPMPESARSPSRSMASMPLLARLAAAGYPAAGEIVPFDTVDGGPVRVAYVHGPDGVVLTFIGTRRRTTMTARYPRTVLATCCLPWRDDGRLDEPLFRRTVSNLVAAGLPDLYVFGTAGEGHAVSEGDFRRVVTIFAEEMSAAGGRPMVGVISLSLPTILERIAFAAELRRAHVPVQPAELGAAQRQRDAQLLRRDLRRVSRTSQFLHYNLLRTGRLVRPQEYAELAEAHPNLVATKYGAGDPETVAGLLQLRARSSATSSPSPASISARRSANAGCSPRSRRADPARAWEYFRAGVEWRPGAPHRALPRTRRHDGRDPARRRRHGPHRRRL